jgi:hypothetical protein
MDSERWSEKAEPPSRDRNLRRGVAAAAEIVGVNPNTANSALTVCNEALNLLFSSEF